MTEALAGAIDDLDKAELTALRVLDGDILSLQARQLKHRVTGAGRLLALLGD